MESYSTASGDRILVEWGADGSQSFGDDVSLALCRKSPKSSDSRSADGVLLTDGALSTDDALPTDGILTSATHPDALHQLFRDGTRFRIRVTPDDDGEPFVVDQYVLLSSSGKWVRQR